jgi:hypothetical protein
MMTRLVHRLEAHPLAWPMAFGLAARLVVAWCAVGFFGRDDYFHVLEPALRWLDDPAFVWETSGAAGAGLRSHLVPRAVWAMLRVARDVGLTTPEAQLRFIQTCLAVHSLALVPAMYLTGRRLLPRRAALVAAWLGALHFALPYLGTRLLLEALAMPWLVFGVYLASFATRGRLVAAGISCGMAMALRYPVAAAFVGLLGAVIWRERSDARNAAARGGLLALGAVLPLVALGFYDAHTSGGFLRPLVANVAANLAPSPDLSRSNAFTYLGLLLLLTIPPATLVVAPAMVRAARHLTLVSWPLAAFVLVHSLVPHKEERFLAPIVPLFLLLLAAAPEALADAVGPWWERLQRHAAWAWRMVAGAHLVMLVVVLTSSPQASLREVMVALRQDGQARAVVSLGPELQLFFLGSEKLPARYAPLREPAALPRALAALAGRGTPANRFVSFAADRDRTAVLLAAHELLCDEPEVFMGSWLDRLVYALNPAHNARRSPVLLWRCERPAVAATRSRGLEPAG